MDKKISPAIRLKKHHHLQNILSRCTTKYVDKEIYIILCSFIGRVDLRATDKQLREVGNIQDIFTKITKDTTTLNSDTKFITNVSEASLIDYFNPEFNSDFIGTFGRKNHSYYNQIIKAQIESISVEIDLNELCRTYSDIIEPHKHHGINYNPKEDFTRTNFHHDIENGV